MFIVLELLYMIYLVEYLLIMMWLMMNFLGIKICNGLRPKFNIKVPQLIEDIVKQCGDADPLKRPTAVDLYKIFDQWYDNYFDDDEDSEIYKQIKEVDEFNETNPSSSINTINTFNTELAYIHPQA